MPGARPPRMGAQEYEENLRAGRLNVTGFANVLGGAVSATLFGYLWGPEQRAMAKGTRPVARDGAWRLIAAHLEVSKSTLSKIAFGRRYPSLVEIERLLALPRIGDLLATNVVHALASETSLLQNVQELRSSADSRLGDGSVAPGPDPADREEPEMLATPQKRRETERMARTYIAVLAENQDVDDRLNQKRFSSVDWVDIFDRIEAQGVLRFGRGTRPPKPQE